MAKRIFALLVLFSTGAYAHELSPQIDGCAVLNEIIYEEVTASGWGITGADLAHTNFREPSVVVCTSTTQTVSKAFSNALSATGGEVSWGSAFNYPEDVCLSGFLEQCVPGYGEKPLPRLGPGALASWQAISNTVVRAMPDGPATDRSIFSEASLRLAIRAALRTRGLL